MTTGRHSIEAGYERGSFWRQARFVEPGDAVVFKVADEEKYDPPQAFTYEMQGMNEVSGAKMSAADRKVFGDG